MFYYLSLFKDDISFLNIFNYITFRTGAAIFTSFFLTLLIGPRTLLRAGFSLVQKRHADHGRNPYFYLPADQRAFMG